MGVWKKYRSKWKKFNDDNPFISFVLDVIIAFVLVKFLILPGAGLVFDTDIPVVVVMSGSMEHDQGFEEWWDLYGAIYEGKGITREQFADFDFDNGFNKGDLMFVRGVDSYEVGDVIVFAANRNYPLIHRIVEVGEGYSTLGDHNRGVSGDFEKDISFERVHGKAFLRIPYVGWLKLLVMGEI
jgi:signal peptidase I